MFNEWKQRRRRNTMTAEVIIWLDRADTDRMRETIQTWDEKTWQAAEDVVQIQGVGPYLHHTLSRTPVYSDLAPSFRQRLANEYAMNEARVRQLHSDLSVILRNAYRAGIRVMPLKGSLMSALYYPSPALRPMADLDLLIRPEDEACLTALLEKQGYQRISPVTHYTSHSRFINRDARGVVSWQEEHPENPRPVEIHVGIKKALWGDFVYCDLTAFLWTDSREVDLLGQKACVPTPERVLAYLAMHAMYDCLLNRGRVIQWLDLALCGPLVRDPAAPDANWVYPALRLAARVFPSRFADVDLSVLAKRAHPRLRNWAAKVPLDKRCGLNLNMRPRQNGWLKRWARWRISPSRLALGYGDTPLPLACGKFVIDTASFLRRWEASYRADSRAARLAAQ